jgi:two-component system, LytTR family, response regulator
MRALIVDDEPLARARLRLLLKPHGDVEIVGEAGNSQEASQLMSFAEPDLLLLDIEMPQGSGFDVLNAAKGERQPVVIFTTAHAEFAAEAFDVSAADYLVKPFDQQRLDRALDRARRVLARSSRSPEPSRVAGRWRERFAVRSRGQILFIKSHDVQWIGAEGNYARLYTTEGSFLIREPLRRLEETLDPAVFIRVHRSAIVNIDRIRKLVAGMEGTYSIVLHSGATVPLGPSFRHRLEELVGEKL